MFTVSLLRRVLRRSHRNQTRDPRQRRGQRAELWAAVWLRLRGAHILARRYPTPAAEVDLVLVHGPDLVVVEVKSRVGLGEIVVHPDQRARLVNAALWLDDEYGVRDSGIRIDIVSVHWARRDRRWRAWGWWPRIEWERAAFGEAELERSAGRHP